MRMNTLFTACLAAEILMSLVSFCVYAYDKHQAKTGGWRVPERTLLCSPSPSVRPARWRVCA